MKPDATPATAKKKKKRNRKKISKPSSSSSAGDRPPATPHPADEVAAKDEEARAIDWLVEAFSSASFDEIASAYGEAGGDAYKAAGILSTDLVDPGEVAKKSSPSRRRPRKVVASAGTVSGVIGKGYSSPKPPPFGGEGGRKAWGQEARGPGNMAYSVEEAEQFLCSMLGESCDLDMAVVRDVLSQCGYDVEKALDALIGISDAHNSRLTEMSSKNYRNVGLNYSSGFSELSSNGSSEHMRRKCELTEKISDSAYHLSENKHEFPQSVGYVCRDYTDILTGSVEQPPSRSGRVQDLQQKVLECLFNISNSPKHEPKCMNWKKVVQKVESFGQGLEIRIASNTETLPNDRNGKEDAYQVFRSAARKHWDMMRTYYQRAAIAYTKGERAHASYLSEQGKYFNKLAREADEKASREIFEARNKDIKNEVTIDLHGQHVKQAMRLLKLHLLLFTYIPSIHFLKVITGCGSDGVGKGKLKCAVIGLVEKEGIKWSEENSGTLLIRVDGMKEYSFMDSESDPD